MREHKNFWDRNAGLYDCFMRKDRERVSEEGGVSSGRTENESQGQESPKDDQGWSGPLT